MTKNIVYCSDGTWNKGEATNTNVFRLYRALEKSAAQTTIYDEGVGSDGSILDRLRGGAFGAGLIENVRQGYELIAQNYQDGDLPVRIQQGRLHRAQCCRHDRVLRTPENASRCRCRYGVRRVS